MKYVRKTMELTHQAALEMLRAGVAAADEIGQPQCIVIVDKSGESLAALRMTGSKYLSLLSARAKARTAASIGVESSMIPPQVAPLIAAATQGAVTGLGGGLPVYMDDVLLGGIGVGSGSPEQDRAVAIAALDAIGAQWEKQAR
ncbi:heme-binding protein [uncultured Hoeflea sp.]|uniref:GlcG/HbpS family heme-binding protein n=1 Tax=uncultured Hoeflea sp. TaxID=538666 RepID=UPI0026374DFD|nr:heme-binding protein [uncultured Hoeflea sp.]